MTSMSFMNKYWIIGLSLIFSICVGGISEYTMRFTIKSYLKKDFKSVEKTADEWIKEAGLNDSNKEHTAQDSTLLYYSYLWKSKAKFCMGDIDSSIHYQRQINKLKLTSYKQDFSQIQSFILELTSDFWTGASTISDIKYSFVSALFSYNFNCSSISSKLIDNLLLYR